jgi:hypothetical protein
MYQQPIKCVYEKGGNIKFANLLEWVALDLIMDDFLFVKVIIL